MPVIAKFLTTILRSAQVLGTLYNAGCCTYFIVGLSSRDDVNGRALAVEIISAAGLLWSAFVLVFSICLLQKTFFQFFTIFGDILFIGGNIAIAILLRNSFDGGCNANNLLVPWLVRGGRNWTANCQLIKGVFIVSIILSVLFLLTCLTALLAHRSAKKDRAYGPSPANNYTSGRGKRGKKGDLETAAMGPALAPPVTDNRVSRESEYTDLTEKTNDGLHTGTTTGPGREYLAPRANNAGTDATVSPIPSSTNLRNKEHSHAGQYAMAGALVGGAAAAHHQHKQNAFGQTDNLPNHPGPEDHTTEHIPTSHDQDRLGTMNTYHTNTNSMYSELDNTTTTGPPSSYATPGAYPSSRGAVPPTAYYPAAQHPTELPSATTTNPHYYSSEMDAGYDSHPQEMSANRRYDDYLSSDTPEVDQNRQEVGFGYGSGPGMVGGGSNQVSTLPELGREDGRRF
ncbi:hypothetical protein ABW19_dt0206853 [Dactylella cylindrospora]|nr:hypothetical protein ABW19_dt0206853 [Dactylella cylindrospora]